MKTWPALQLSCLLCVTLAAPLQDQESSKALPTVLISEYLEGKHWDSAIELWNASPDETVSLAGVHLRTIVNGRMAWDGAITIKSLPSELAPHKTWVLCYSRINRTLAGDACDAMTNSTALNLSGDDAVGLFWENVLLDAVGDSNPLQKSGWDVAGVQRATKDHTLLRKPQVTRGNRGNWKQSRQDEWEVRPDISFSHLGIPPVVDIQVGH